MTMADLLVRKEQPLWCPHIYDGKCKIPNDYERLKSATIKDGNWTGLNVIRIQQDASCRQNKDYCIRNKKLGDNK